MTAAQDAEIARLKEELAKTRELSIDPAPAQTTETVYWVKTMRGDQPRCKACDGQLTRGPQGGFTDSECPNCHMELRNGGLQALESR